MRYFVVREEGGEYEYLSKRAWRRRRRLVPIWGYVVGGRMHCYDKIIGRWRSREVRERTKWIATSRRPCDD